MVFQVSEPLPRNRFDIALSRGRLAQWIGSGQYTLHQVAELTFAQTGWRYCQKCKGLFFANNAGSVCPARGSHDKPGSGHYRVYHEAPTAPGQAGWRWCGKCRSLFLGEVPGSVCPSQKRS